MKKQRIGLLSATFLGISAIVGSGWLFAGYKSTVEAGPASVFSWLIGAFLIILLAMCFAEVASLFPKRGLSAIIPTLSHNKFFGFPFAIASWLGVIVVVGLEADATVQYLINLMPKLEPLFYQAEQLTWLGDGLSIILVIFYCAINFWGAKLLVRTNNIFTVFKLLIPIITALVILAVVFHPQNFTVVGHTLVPYGFNSILTAILTTGIIVAFNGFQTVISFASEIKKPHRTIPLSLVIAILFCLGLYVLLQIAFIGAIPPSMLQKGWKTLEFSAPMVELSLMLGLGLLTTIIYFGAALSPLGTAITFVGSATRMFTAMSRKKQMPKIFDRVHPKYGVSRYSLIMNTFLVIVFLLCFRSWGALAKILSLLHVLSYLAIPLALYVFRNTMSPDQYSFKLIGGKIIAPFLFVVFTYLIALEDMSTLVEIIGILAALQIIFILFNTNTMPCFMRAIKQCGLLFLYFFGLIVLTWLSPVNTHHLDQKTFAIVTVIFAIVAFYIMVTYDFHVSEEPEVIEVVQEKQKLGGAADSSS